MVPTILTEVETKWARIVGFCQQSRIIPLGMFRSSNSGRQWFYSASVTESRVLMFDAAQT